MDDAVKQFESTVGHGTYRITRYKGQVIGVEVWPDPKDPGNVEEPRVHWAQQFPYKPPPRWWNWARRALARN